MLFNLNNGCARSEIAATPQNWDIDIATASERTIKNILKKEWQVYYRYYDPAFENDPDLWGKKFPIRAGLNRIKDLAQRQVAAKALIEGEKDKIDNQLFNPITGKYYTLPETVEEITPSMPFIDALKKAMHLVSAVARCKADIKSAITGIDGAAGKIYDKTYQKPYSALKISQVTRKHLVYIFQQCKKDNPRFSANRQNKYRAYLIMLFKELVRVEAIDVNPANDLAIDYTHVKKKRVILTDAEALIIDINLKAWDYYYWRYMRIFYRSGSRSTELLSLRTENVNMNRQEFTLTVKKGKQYKEEVRSIPNDALPFWIEVMEEANPGDYLFSVGFKPGKRHIGEDNVDKRWKKYVKDDPQPVPAELPKDRRKWAKRKFVPLGIKKDFYSLKHKNLDLIEIELGKKAAQKAAGHTSERTTAIYTIGAEQRDRDELKNITIDFSPLLPQNN